MDTPPLTLLVLDGLADDLESVGTLRDHGEEAPSGLALVDEDQVVEALGELVRDGLVAAWGLVEPRFELAPVDTPSTDDASLRRYWYRRTAEGDRVWREGGALLDAYWDAQPPASG